MKLTYIFHSGFVLECDLAILIFDFWHDPNNVIDDLILSKKPIYVFASHFHEDHFNSKIFSWKSKNSNIKYLLSKDILRHRRAKKEDADFWFGKGANYFDENIKVWATGSTDIGVSWVVEIMGKKIFHAGDLNNWYARFLSQENPPESIFSMEFGIEVHPIEEEKKYLGQLKDIQKISKNFDIVMFPVDGRIGNGYTLGARQFIERFKVGFFVPMHFVTSGFESAWRMEEFCKAKNIPFWKIEKEAESILIEEN